MNTNTNIHPFVFSLLRELAAPFVRRDDCDALRIPAALRGPLLREMTRLLREANRAEDGWRWYSDHEISQSLRALRHANRSGAVTLPIDFRSSDGTFPAFTSMGSYPIVYVGDGWCVCADCASVLDQDPDAATDNPIDAAAPNYEDSSLYCDHCEERIESAYAEDAAAAEDHRGTELDVGGMKMPTGTLVAGTVQTAPRLRELQSHVDFYFNVAYHGWLEAMEELGADFDLADDDPNMQSWLLDELIEVADECLPDGWYVGNHPGDGADFGIWRSDD